MAGNCAVASPASTRRATSGAIFARVWTTWAPCLRPAPTSITPMWWFVRSRLPRRIFCSWRPTALPRGSSAARF